MKICLLGNIKSVHLQRWALQLASLGHEISVVSFENIPISNNIKIYQIKSKPPNKLKYIFNILILKKIIKEIKPDIIHAHFLTHYGFMAACLDFKPLIISVWGSDVLILPKKNLLFNLLARFILKKANLVISVAEHMRKSLIQLGCKNEKIVVIPFGVDKNLVERSKSKNLINKTDGSLIIISTRGLEPVYNIKLLVQAIPYVIKKNESAKCIIIGEGSQAKKLKKMAQSLGIMNNIIFKGALPHVQLLDALEMANIYVSTSLSDGCSISLHEAMAMGLFPVCSDIPANKEWITDRQNGFLVPINNPRELAKKILEAHQDKALLDEARRINLEIVNKYAILDDNIFKVEKIYQKIVSIYK